MIYLGADHGGWAVKERIKEWLKGWNFQFEDLGNKVLDGDDDYPDFAAQVAKNVSESKAGDFGILVCRSGHGMDMLANKFVGVRAALCFTPGHAQQARQHENANILCLANDYVPEEKIKEIVKIFLETEFPGEGRHKRRLEKIKKFEQENFKP